MISLEYDTNKSEQADAAEATITVKPNLLTVPKKKAPAVAKAAAEKAVDPLLDRVHVIENYDQETAINRVFECEDKVAETYFELGGALTLIQAKKWFQPYQDFDKWVEGETEMKRSKARALVQIYEGLAGSGLPWSKVSHLGWTKLRRIAGVLTQDNADHWIEVASKHSRSELIELVKQDKAKHNAEHPEMATTPKHK